MKSKRQEKMLDLIRDNEIETQEELIDYLQREGFPVTQATVSRDIRALRITKVPLKDGRSKYAALSENAEELSAKYARVFREGVVSMDTAQNILVVRTVPGMAMAVAAALDAMGIPEIVGCIAGDDTVMCAIRTAEDAGAVMRRLEGLSDT